MEHTEAEIDSVISRQNVSKEGFTTYYVDGTNGNDANNFLRWETAAKTIQAAIDKAESWAKIYVAAGTYAEAVTISSSKNSIHIIGEDWVTTVINATGLAASAIDVRSKNCIIENLYVIHNALGFRAITASAGRLRLHIKKCTINNVSGYGISPGVGAIIEDCMINHVKVGIWLSAAETYGSLSYNGCIIRRNTFYKGVGIGTSGILISLLGAPYCEIYENELVDFATGIDLDGNDASIFHNNFVANTTPINIDGAVTRYKIVENYYSNHTNIDTDNDGLCDSPYTFIGGTDYSPVSKRNGWNQISLGASVGLGITVSNIFSLVNGMLVTTETGGEVSTNGAAEVNVYINNAPAGVYKPLIVKIWFTNQTAAETVIVREKYRIEATGGIIEGDAVTFAGVQDPLLKVIHLDSTRFGVQVTIAKTAGADRAYRWEAVYDI